MKFRTEIRNYSIPIEVSYSSNLFFMGSCFAEYIGDRFESLKFNAEVNPHGILFNPTSIFRSLESILHEDIPKESDILVRDEIAYSWNHHSSVYNNDPEELAREIHRINRSAHARLLETDVLFITLGSAWAYRHQKSKQIVANCHKQAQQDFVKELINSETIVEHFNRLYALLKSTCPKLKVVLNVSPVRYTKDGLIESNRSKAELIRASHQLVNIHQDCFYLPSYEWVIDDLRDYRFFEADLIHPNSLAIDYVWEQLEAQLIRSSAREASKEVKRFYSGFEHKAFHVEGRKHQRFLEDLLKLGLKLQEDVGLNLRYEIHQIESQLNTTL